MSSKYPISHKDNQTNFIFPNTIESSTHMNCLLKCTCPKSPNLNSMQHPLLSKQRNILDMKESETNYLNCKSVCDANTSPGLRCIRSPKSSDQKNLNNDENKNINLNGNNGQRYFAKPNPSPRRLISTRNAATSPHLDMRKVQRNEIKTKDIRKEKFAEMENNNATSSNRASLEKSNSLGESKPNRQLRTTRSLSPRPPVRHQHAIMVSDENDIVSVKVSPSDDYDSSLNHNHNINNLNSSNKSNNNKIDNININNKFNAIAPGTSNCTNINRTAEKIEIRKHKAKSEQTSPNITDFDGIFTYECKPNNKSTGCLIYVPSDPWLKMSDSEKNRDEKVLSLRKPKPSSTKASKLSKESRSLSRGNVESEDPWVWRKDSENPDNIASSNSNIKRSPKQDVYRQSKSFSVTKFPEFSIPDSNFSSKNNRPKLQRCKAPFFTEDDFRKALNNKLPQPPTSPTFLIAPPSDNQYSLPSIYNYPTSVSQQQNQNHPQQLQQPSSPSAISNKTTRNIISANSSPRKDSALVFQFQQQQQIQHQQSQQINKSLLNVLNPNVMQARHSFSSGSTNSSAKDDELQLNIRRLSEQIKHNQSSSNSGIVSIGASSGGADFSDYLKQFRCSEAKKAAAELAALQQVSINSNTTNSSSTNAISSISHEQSVTKSPRNTTKNSDRVLETTC